MLYGRGAYSCGWPKHNLVALGFLTRIRRINMLYLYVDAEFTELYCEMAMQESMEHMITSTIYGLC